MSQGSSETMIEFYHVNKQYVKGQFALKNITYSISKGEFVFLTGESGAGKTTLLRLIFKEELPNQGQILINSININTIPAKRLYQLRRQIGIIFQDFKLLLNRTVFENVAIPLLVRNQRHSTIEKKVTSSLTLVGLNHLRNYPTNHISGGEQQRVAIARAIVGTPKILIADEPTGNLDTKLSQEIIQIFKRISEYGITILIATHDNSLIERFSSRTLRLHNGELVADERRQLQ